MAAFRLARGLLARRATMLPPSKRDPTPPPGSQARNVLRDLVWHAALAPSSHNAQPWRFRLISRGVELYADRSRSLPILDPDDRELVMSCGAALLNLRLAVRALGHRDVVEINPEPSKPDLIARVLLDEPHPSTPEERALCAAIPRRRTATGAFDGHAVPAPVVARICAAAAEEGAMAVIVDQARKRKRIAELCAEGEMLMAQDPSYRQALSAWAYRGAEPVSTAAQQIQTSGEMLSRLAGLLRRSKDEIESHARSVQKLAEDAPLLVVIATMRDDETAWIGAGQALQRVLLTATAEDISASFCNQPIEVRSLRQELRLLLEGVSYPQVVLRFGHCPMSTPSPRRNVDDVLL